VASLAFSQDAPSTQTSHPAADTSDFATKISVKVNVVNVLATVRDKPGKIVNNLSKQDFTLTEDGRPQSIHYFSRETDLPLTLGLLVDTSLSQRRVLDQERSASHSFLDQMVREDRDQAFIIHFDRDVELLQDLTCSHQKLEQALNALKTPEYTQTDSNGGGGSGPDGGHGGGRHGGHRGGGTTLYDAVFLASDELMRKQEGRRRSCSLPMAWIEEAKRASTQPSSQPSAPTPWFIPSFSRTTSRTEGVAVSGGPASVFPAAAIPEDAAAASATLPNRAPTERKSSKGFPRKLGDASLKSPKSNRSIRFIPRSRRNSAISTTWATPLIAKPATTPAITRSSYRQSKKI